MMCFVRLVMAHINSIIPDTLDPLQFAYDAQMMQSLLHCSFPPRQNNSYVRMLFIAYSSAFNTIVSSIVLLITKLRTLGLNTSLCNWILDFLTGCPQVIRIGTNTSATLILNAGAPQRCVLSPLLYSLFPHDCVVTPRQL